MKGKSSLIITLLVLSHFYIGAQNYFEAYLGPSITNVRHLVEGQQIVYNHTLNSPLWNIGLQLGINRVWSLNDKILLGIGLRGQLRGDRDSDYEIAPNRGDLHSMRFYYLMAPVNLSHKLMRSKNIYIKYGISGDFLFKQNQTHEGLDYFPTIDTFKERLGVTCQIGFSFFLNEKFAFEVMYSQSITNIHSLEFTPGGSVSKFTYKHQAFEFTFSKKL
jgi:opacity protein-like surface antigen